MNILDQILETKRREVAALKAQLPFGELYARAKAHTRPVRSFSGALSTSPSGIIAEFKRRSPSKGFINREARPEEIVPGYETAGAAAVSVLTDRDYFAGSLDDLRRARAGAQLPLLRKDFVIDAYQIAEARLAEADAVLLIAAALTPAQTSSLASFAHELDLEVLLEIHREQELGHLCDAVDVVGVNNRDLTTFVTDIRVSLALAPFIPDRFVRISESGLSSPEAVRALREAGFSGFLMGENFMKRPDPAAALREFIEAL